MNLYILRRKHFYTEVGVVILFFADMGRRKKNIMSKGNGGAKNFGGKVGYFLAVFILVSAVNFMVIFKYGGVFCLT